MFGGSEININFPRPIPVHLTYQTAFVDQNGKLQFRADVYGRDARMIAILKNARERRVAYIPVAACAEHFVEARAHAGRHVPGRRRLCRNGNGGGYNFFDWLFGARGQQPPAQYYRPRQRHFIGPRADDNGRFSRR